MALNFPANPAAQSPVNTYSPTSTPDATTNGATYVWNGTAWTGSVDGVGVSITSAATFPSTADPNDLLFNSDNGKLYIYYQDVDSSQWVDTSADATSSLVTVSQSAPLNPVQGQLWWDSSTTGGVLYIYYSDIDSNQWVEVGGSGDGGGGGGATVESGSIPPENPKVNSLWFNDVTGKLYIYYQDADGSQWVDTDVGGTTEQMPTGGVITGGGTDRVFYENQQKVTADYTLDADTNAMSAGPVTVDDGVSVTVPAGQTRTVVGGGSGGGGGGDSGFWQRNGTTLSPASAGDNVSTVGGLSGANLTLSGSAVSGGFDTADGSKTGVRVGSEGQVTVQRTVASSTGGAFDILSGTTATFAVLGTGETRIGGNVSGDSANINLDPDGSASFAGTNFQIFSSGSFSAYRATTTALDTLVSVKSDIGGTKNEVFQVAADGSVAIAGDGQPLGTISLNADGSAIFADRVRSKDFSASGSTYVDMNPTDGFLIVNNNFTKGNLTMAGEANLDGYINSGSIACEPSSVYSSNTASFIQPSDATTDNKVLSLKHAGTSDGYLILGGDASFTTPSNASFIVQADGTITNNGTSILSQGVVRQHNSRTDAPYLSNEVTGTNDTGGWAYGMSASSSSYYVQRMDTGAGVNIAPGGTSWQANSSERRLKENIKPISATTAWDTVKTLPFYEFNFIGHDTVNFGPMADEVPSEMKVATNKTDDVGVIHTYDSGMLQGRLFVALQESLKRIEELEAKVTALEG